MSWFGTKCVDALIINVVVKTNEKVKRKSKCVYFS